jgi:carboxymethylenebutenolidase
MCYGNDSSPPEHGVGGKVSSEEDLVLTSADGTRFQTRLARPAEPNGKGVVILPDVRGLYSFYCALARKFAEAGIEAIAIDYFGRTAGLTADRPDNFEWQAHLPRVAEDAVNMDVSASIGALGDLGTVREVFTVGFCWGGGLSWRQSAAQPGLSGAIGFYGRPERIDDALADMRAPLLLLLAGDDAATPADKFDTLKGRLTREGVIHRAVTYEGAPHSFFDRTSDQWADACKDSWRQIFSFMKDPSAA